MADETMTALVTLRTEGQASGTPLVLAGTMPACCGPCECGLHQNCVAQQPCDCPGCKRG